MLAYLFVYGTLRGAANTEWSRRLAAVSCLVGPGRVRGILFQLDGIVGMTAATDGEAWVTGEVVRLNDPGLFLPMLDDYEGCQYHRQAVEVELEDGRVIEAWAYFYGLSTEGRPRIASGDCFGFGAG